LGMTRRVRCLIPASFKVNDCFTLNDVALVDRLRYNMLSVSQLVNVDFNVLFHKSDSHVLDSSGKHVCGISRIENVFKLISHLLNLL
jgi:hypothetical protein